jgi:hypothetical protein
MDWPKVVPDEVVRLRALAAAMPHVLLLERDFDVPFDVFWNLVGDLEQGVPQFEQAVGRSRIIQRDGESLVLDARTAWGGTERFDVVLRPGYCVMRSRSFDIGMAARALADGGTRFAHFEGSRLLGRIARPLARYSIRSDFKQLERLFRREGEGA